MGLFIEIEDEGGVEGVMRRRVCIPFLDLVGVDVVVVVVKKFFSEIDNDDDNNDDKEDGREGGERGGIAREISITPENSVHNELEYLKPIVVSPLTKEATEDTGAPEAASIARNSSASGIVHENSTSRSI